MRRPSRRDCQRRANSPADGNPIQRTAGAPLCQLAGLGLMPVQGPRSRAAGALRMNRREMPGERQVAAPLMAQRAAHRAPRPAHRRRQPGHGAGVQLAGPGRAASRGGPAAPVRTPNAGTRGSHSSHRQPRAPASTVPCAASAGARPLHRPCVHGRAAVSPAGPTRSPAAAAHNIQSGTGRANPSARQRRAGNSRRWFCQHQLAYWRRSRAYASCVRPV
jgi:hypothetical protein